MNNNIVDITKCSTQELQEAKTSIEASLAQMTAQPELILLLSAIENELTMRKENGNL